MALWREDERASATSAPEKIAAGNRPTRFLIIELPVVIAARALIYADFMGWRE